MAPQLLGVFHVRVGALAARIETPLAEKAFAASDRKRHDDTVADFQLLHLAPDLDDDTHRLVADDIAAMHARDDAVIHMQVRAADRSGGDPDNRIARALDRPVGHRVATHVALSAPTE